MTRSTPKPWIAFMVATVLVISNPAESQELRSADDLLWLIDHDRRTLSVEYQRILTALDAGRVPSAAKALDVAIRFKLAHGGMLAEEQVRVVALLRIGRDVPPLARKGDAVWVVRISHAQLGVTQEMWIGAATGEVRVMLPLGEK